MKQPVKINRFHFLLLFVMTVVVLAIVKCVNPAITWPRLLADDEDKDTEKVVVKDSITLHAEFVDSLLDRPRKALTLVRKDGSPVKNRVLSVPRFEDAFPDMNDVQLATASRLGVSRIANRQEAHKCMDKLVYVADNPFYHVQQLRQSIPYLVPRAARLLEVIARSFNDSLQVKGFTTPHKLYVTSVLRTAEDVARLRNVNQNASENSCHQYGTTFDISYNRFMELSEDGKGQVRYVTVFKSILAEVLRDQRAMGTCYVKYEKGQACFHITAR